MGWAGKKLGRPDADQDVSISTRGTTRESGPAVRELSRPNILRRQPDLFAAPVDKSPQE
jgi:hypothetical protein